MNFEDFNWAGCGFPESYLRSIFEFSKARQFNGVCLEIGFDAGCSALAFLRGSPEAILMSIDIQDCQKGMALIDGFEVRSRHTFVKADSRNYIKGLQGPFKYIYIDGDHDYDVVKQDLQNCAKLLSEHGVMLVDDCDDNHQHFGVARAVKEFISEFGFRLDRLEGSPSSAVILTKI